jgi:diaminopimelate epimerase
MHGCGNDYVFVDARRRPVRNAPALARAVSDRRFGIGADGLILILPSRRADARMRIFNADGSEGRTCGNGLRCLAKYLYERDGRQAACLRIETASGVVEAVAHARNGRVHRVSVAMGPLRVVERRLYRPARGDRRVERARILGRTAYVASVGNPHCVFFVDDPDAVPLERIGPQVERDPRFPERTNVEFASVRSRRCIEQRTWERGSGETLACGSGACAVAGVAMEIGLVYGRATVRLRGGEVEVRRDPQGVLWLTGPAVEICEGVWSNR